MRSWSRLTTSSSWPRISSVIASPRSLAPFGLAQVFRAGSQQGNLAPGQARRQHQRVEPVVLGLAVPQRGQRVLEDLAQAAGSGGGRRPQAELVDPERP